jgi:predicted outer membrane repeat protein
MVLPAFSALLLGGIALAETYVVNPDGTGDFPTIQAAIEGTSHGDIIELTDGVFTGPGNRDVGYRGKAVTVRSQSGNAATCIIDCEGFDRGFAFSSGEGPGSVLHGVTIIDGRSDIGAALYCDDGSCPTISGCVFSGNHSSIFGGGLFCVSYASPSVTDCVFSDNSASVGGGAVMCWSACAPSFMNCVFTDNTATRGGAVDCFDWSPPIFVNCTFSGNSAWTSGGGIHCDSFCWPTLENCIVAFCSEGAAVTADESSSPTLACCDVYGNADGDWVGPIWDQFGIDGNVSVDPLFCEEVHEEDPYSLWSFSPCTAENNPECGQIGARSAGCFGILVESDGTGDFPTIQAAIDAASDGEVICLENGVFTGVGNRDVDFQGKSIELRSLHLDPKNCIIDCELSGRGLFFHSGEGPSSAVRGLAILYGSADRGAAVACESASPSLSDCILGFTIASGQGGGIYCNDASPSIVNCTLARNSAEEGAGMYCAGFSAPTMENSIIAFGGMAEAIACDGSSAASLACCDLYGNAGGDWVGCVADQYGIAGNISENPQFCGFDDFGLDDDSPCRPYSPPNEECDLIGACPVSCVGTYLVRPDGTGDFPTIQAAIDAVLDGAVIELATGIFAGEGNRDVDFHGKAIVVRSQSGDPALCVVDCEGSASEPHRGFNFLSGEGLETVLEGLTITNGYGGAVRCVSASSPSIVRCSFRGNSVGGALYANGSSPRITSCTFYGNEAVTDGAITLINCPAPVIERSIISFSNQGPGVFCYGESAPLLMCCDVYGNAGGDWIGCIADQLGVNGNIAEDPLFCDPGETDFRVQENSPCAPFSPPNPECDLIGALEAGCSSAAPDDLAGIRGIRLGRPAPNPFTITTAISYILPEEAKSVHDA